MNKKYLLSGVFSLALLIGAGIANAQDIASVNNEPPAKAHFMRHRPEGFHGKHDFRKDMEEKLKLTDEQKAQAKKIHEDGRKEIEPLMEQMKEIRAKMDEIRKKNMEEFEKILTPEQKTEMEQMKANMKDKMEKHHRPHGNGMLPPPPAHGAPDDMPLPPPPVDAE